MPEWWTNRSRLPSSGVMKPNPLSSLNHFTVPVAMQPILRTSSLHRVSPGLTAATYQESGLLLGLRGDLDLALEDLAGGALGELVDEPDLARILVVGDLVLDVVAQRRLVDVLALLERDRSADLLAHVVVGD